MGELTIAQLEAWIAVVRGIRAVKRRLQSPDGTFNSSSIVLFVLAKSVRYVDSSRCASANFRSSRRCV